MSYPKSPMAYSPSNPTQTARITTPVEYTSVAANQPHLVSLVLQSKKALQHGEQLCTRAHTSSNESAQAAVDVLALDAKVRWVVEAVVEQLQLAANVAKTLEDKRAQIARQINEWDAARTQHTDSLDDILESLGAQVVPPDFHQHSSDSSLFGSQHSADLEFGGTSSETKHSNSTISRPLLSPRHSNTSGGYTSQLRSPQSPVSPSATLPRNGSVRQNGHSPTSRKISSGKNQQGIRDDHKNKVEQRKRWKTLRDFVDDQAIEIVLETIECDRSALEDTINKTDQYPETLTRTIQTIRSSLPFPDDNDAGALKSTQHIVIEQEKLVNSMAELLESLAGHYDGMASALKDSENGDDFSEEDLQVMNRDTEELPAIMGELEESAEAIDQYHSQLTNTKDGLEKDLEHLVTVLNDLDELGEIMDEMIRTQESLEIEAHEEISRLHDHLTALQSTFHVPYVEYRTAYSKLLLELDRRRQYKESVENIVNEMAKKLESMTEEENRVRDHFNKEYGGSLPLDLCLYVANTPTRWDILPSEGSAIEMLPSIDTDLLVMARDKVGYPGETVTPGLESQ